MKLNTNSNEVALSGMSDVATGFKIEANAKAFRALSSTLYKDQIGSVLREIVCNGIDANKMTGSTIPVEVKLPNSINPTFYVRDTGPGLSEEDIKSLYTTYFSSTKDQSNDQIGAFGLGSKSPFAYTDSFTVVSAHGGMKKTYAAFLSEAGDPSILKVTEEPVSPEWEHGLEIGFPVKPKDFAEFERKAQTQLQWLEPLPTLKGVAVRLERPAISWQFGPFSRRMNADGAMLTIVMGGVAYTLSGADIATLSQYVDDKNCLHTRNLCLEMPLGSVEVSLSREGLSMTEYTLKALAKVIDRTLLKLRQKLKDEEALFKNGRSFVATVEALRAENLIEAANDLIGWQHHFYPNKRSDDLEASLKMTLPEVPIYLKQFGIKMETKFTRKQTTKGFMLEEGFKNSTLLGKTWDEIVWVINDKAYNEATMRERLRYLMQTNPDKYQIFVFSAEVEDNPEFARITGVQALKLGDLIIPKKPKSEKVSRPEIGPVALLAKRKRMDSPMVHTGCSYSKVDVLPEGSFPELEKGEVGYFIRLDLARTSSYNNVAANIGEAFNGLNSSLRRLGAPTADFVYAIHRKTDQKKALAMGYLDLAEVLYKATSDVSKYLATLPIRQALRSIRKPAEGMTKHVPYIQTNSVSILLRVLSQFSEAKKILEGTWILRDLQKLYTPEFVQVQEDYLCLYNLIRGLQAETKFSVIANAEKPEESLWTEQEALFQKLDLPEIQALAQVISDYDVSSKTEIVLAFVRLLRLRPEPVKTFAAVA